MPSPVLILCLLLTFCFSLSTYLEPRQRAWIGQRTESESVLETLLGDARRLFAQHFFVKADVYFHSGYYPSMFDQAAEHDAHVATDAGVEEAHHEPEHDHGEEPDFLGKPRDWLDGFSRAFYPSTHTHLEEAHDK